MGGNHNNNKVDQVSAPMAKEISSCRGKIKRKSVNQPGVLVFDPNPEVHTNSCDEALGSRNFFGAGEPPRKVCVNEKLCNPRQGDSWTDTESGYVYIYDDCYWNLMPARATEIVGQLAESIEIQGPAGAQGPVGAPGAQGIQGPTGAQGIQGIKGAELNSIQIYPTPYSPPPDI